MPRVRQSTTGLIRSAKNKKDVSGKEERLRKKSGLPVDPALTANVRAFPAAAILPLPRPDPVPASPAPPLPTVAVCAPNDIALPESALWVRQLIARVPPASDGMPPLLHAILTVADIPASERLKFALPDTALLKTMLDAAGISKLVVNDHDKCLYLLHRMRGCDHSQAEKECRYGPLYLKYTAEDQRKTIRALLAASKISASPLCFPRKSATVPTPMKVLGKGASNKVYEVTIDGKRWAWKPADPEAGPSSVAEHCGIKGTQYFPVESNLIMAKIAAALAPKDGSGPIVGQTLVAIINDEPGLLMEIAEGSNELMGGHMYRKEVKPTTSGYQACLTSRGQLSEPAKYKATCDILGVTGLSWTGSKLFVTGVARGRPTKADLFDSPAFLKRMCDGGLIADLTGWSDSHTGNIIVNLQPGTDEVTVRFVDGDDAGAAVDYVTTAAATDDDSRHAIYFLSPPARWLDRSTAEAFASPEFEQALAALNHDLQSDDPLHPFYPKERLDAINRRINLRSRSWRLETW